MFAIGGLILLLFMCDDTHYSPMQSQWTYSGKQLIGSSAQIFGAKAGIRV